MADEFDDEAANDEVAIKPNDWVAIEYIREILDDVRARLRAGSEGEGTTLTLDADECLKVLACLIDPPWPNTRPRNNPFEKYPIAWHCFDLEKSGVALKNAVADTAKHFGCSESKVRMAREEAAWTRPSK